MTYPGMHHIHRPKSMLGFQGIKKRLDMAKVICSDGNGNPKAYSKKTKQDQFDRSYVSQIISTYNNYSFQKVMQALILYLLGCDDIQPARAKSASMAFVLNGSRSDATFLGQAPNNWPLLVGKVPL